MLGLIMKWRGPVAMAALVLVPVVLWALAPLPPRFPNATSGLSSLAVVFGLAGMTAFALNVILGARLKPVSSFFGGLDPMYFAHRVNGRVVFWLLAAHAGLVVAARWTLSFREVGALLDPGNGWTVPLGVIAFLGLGLALYLTLYARLGHEMFVYVQRVLGFLFLVGALHAFRTPGAKALSQPLTLYLAAVAAAALAAYLYSSLFGNVLVLRRDYEVARVNELDPQVVEVTLAPKGEPLRFVPGQFVFVTFFSDSFNAQFHPFSMTAEGKTAIISIRPGDVRNQFHPFSITSAAGERDLKVVVKAVGDYTRAMHKLDRGAVARVEGPYGTFSYLNVGNRRQVWIAGGIGVTPFLSMARSLDVASYEVDLHYATKNADVAYFVDEFRSIAEGSATFNLFLYPEDEVGFLTAERLADATRDLDERDIFICGPPVMIDALSEQLRTRGIADRRIHFERFAFGPS